MIKKFIKETFLIGIATMLGAWLIAVTIPFHYFNREYPIWRSKIDFINDSNDNFVNLLIGDSRLMAAVNPKILGEKYYNLALVGGTPIEGYYQLKRLLRNNKPINILILSYAPFHLEGADYWERAIKFGFYGEDDLYEIFDCKYLEGNEFWVEHDLVHNKLLYKPISELMLLKFPYFFRSDLSKSFLLRGAKNHKKYNEIKKNNGYALLGKDTISNGFNYEAERNFFKANKVISYYLEKLLHLATENNIKVYYIQTPFNEASYNFSSLDYLKRYNSYLNNLAKQNPKVIFKERSIYYYPDDQFCDPSHMNERGAKKFSNQLKGYLTTFYTER